MLRHTLTICGLLVLVTKSANAQPTARVSGRFVDSLSGEPITIAAPVTLGTFAVPLDSAGKFSFEKVEPGRYELSFGTICWRRHRVVVNVAPGADVNLFDIRLTRLNCEGPNPRTGEWEYPARPTCEIRFAAPTDTVAGRRVRMTRDSAQVRWHLCTGFDGLGGAARGGTNPL